MPLFFEEFPFEWQNNFSRALKVTSICRQARGLTRREYKSMNYEQNDPYGQEKLDIVHKSFTKFNVSYSPWTIWLFRGYNSQKPSLDKYTLNWTY